MRHAQLFNLNVTILNEIKKSLRMHLSSSINYVNDHELFVNKFN
jgi:hypothetical protein